jgi:hypothetical protein
MIILGRGRAAPGPTAAPPTLPAGSSWARFGDEVVLLASDRAWPTVARRARGGGLEVESARRRVRRERLHVAVQHGRQFQQHHPRVPVLVDRGRFLLVDLDPRRARQLARAHPTCYGVIPLADGQVVFDLADRGALRGAPAAEMQALVDRLSRPALEGALTRLTALPTRLSTSPQYAKAAAWTRQTLGDHGYGVRYQKVAVGGRSSRNVIAERRGQAPAASRQVVIVTAHLDSINLAGGASAPAPGADDNGSGSAGLLEMARVLAGDGRHDLRFILFGGEEQGLFGSRRYVETLTAAERARIRAVVNMDMIGSLNSSTRTVLLEGAALAQRVMDGLGRAAATYTDLTVERSLNPFASDHVPFIDAGIPAVLTIEGSDNTNTAIHSERDTLDRITYDFALEILRMNVAFVAEEVRAAS